MKRLRKFLTAAATCLMICISALSLTGCSQDELKDNTETVLNTATSIIPVELSKETAQGMYATAIDNFLKSKSYEIEVNLLTGKESQTISEIGMLNSKGKRFIYNDLSFTYDESSPDAKQFCYGYYNDEFCSLDIKTKKYYVTENYLGMVCGQVTNIVFTYSFNSIISGRYYNGLYYISATITSNDDGDEPTTSFVEFLIKDNMFMEAHIIITQKDIIIQSGQCKFNYKDVDTSNIITSLEGYTKAQ